MALSDGAARANELGEMLESICKRFEAGGYPQVRDVRRIRKASFVLKRLAFVAEGLATSDLQFNSYDAEGAAEEEATDG